MPVPAGSAPGDLRRSNVAAALRLLRREGRLSRADLARSLGLTRTTAGFVIASLVDEGLVREVGVGPSSGGKPPILLEIAPNGVLAIGIDLSQSGRVRGVLCDLLGEPLRSRSRAFTGRDYPSILSACLSLVKELREGAPSKRVEGIGLAISGIVDEEGGRVTRSVHFDLADRDLAADLGRETGLPVSLGNDARLMARLEATSGAHRGVEPLLYVHVAAGLGAAWTENGRPAGSEAGGQLGALRVPPRGDLLESALRKASDPAERGRLLGWGASAVAALVAPQAIVFGGLAVDADPEEKAALVTSLREALSPGHLGDFPVAFSTFGEWGPARGGAEKVLSGLTEGFGSERP